MSDTPQPPRAALVATPTRNGAMAIIPRTFEEVWRFATMLAQAGEMVPVDYRGKPEACALAVMWGMELGISPIQAVQGIAPIKGRAAVWGDLALALVMQHPDFLDMIEEPLLDAAGGIMGYRVTAKRRERADVVREFTLADAAKAGLIKRAMEKGGPWRDYPQRMCQMRARSWAQRDQFADALRGLYPAEEANDIPGEFTVVDTPTRAAEPPIQQPQPRAEAASNEEAKPEAAALEPPAPNPLDDLATQQVQQAGVDFSDMDDLDRTEVKPTGPAPKQAQAAQEALSGDLLPRDDAPPTGDRGALGKAQASTLNAYLQTLEGIGVMEQELFDELGDSVHAGNFDAAIRWCESRLKRGKA